MYTFFMGCIAVFVGLIAGFWIGMWIAGDFDKTYPADFVPGPKFRAGLSKNPEE